MNKNETSSMRSVYMTMLSSLGYVVILLGIIVLIPCSMILFYPEERHIAHEFILPGVLSILVGYFIRTVTGGYATKNLKRHEGSFMVVLIWLVSILIGAMPFYLSKDYTFTQAVFEATSGFTTTGFTVTDVGNAPHMILFYRSILHLFGGVGLILILSTALSEVYGMQLFNAEGHRDAVVPSLKNMSRTILLIYLSLIAAGSLLYWLFGMSPFDAVNHAISAVSTGGFSTKVGSIGAFNSIPIDIITIVLMLFGATNFMAILFLVKGNFKYYIQNMETQVMLALICFFSPVVVVLLLLSGASDSLLTAIDTGVFQVVSVVTTTGFTTIDDMWLNAGFMTIPLVFLMLIGGNSGSTAGGFKSFRFGHLVKQVIWTFQDMVSPSRMHHPHMANHFGYRTNVSDDVLRETNAYLFLFLNTSLLGAFGLTLFGFDFRDSFVEFVSILSTVGVSIGITSAELHAGAMWIMIVGMLIGRLEVYVIPLAIYRFGSDLAALFRHTEHRIEVSQKHHKELKKRSAIKKQRKEAKQHDK